MNNFYMINNDTDLILLSDGDVYFDTRDNNYYYYSVNNGNTLSTLISTTAQNNYATFSYVNSSSYSSIDERKNIKRYLKENPEFLDELICELRKEKIEKILNK